MVTYLKDTDLVEVYDGSAFEAVSQPGILQVVSTTKTDTFSVTSTTFTDVTDFEATITPFSDTSKILVIVEANVGNSTTNNTTMLQLFRGATLIAAGDTAGSRARVFAGMRQADTVSMYNAGINVLDSPATASAVTYKVAMASRGGATGHLNRSGDDTDSANLPRGASSITLLEVAA
jgi:hypothetical protein